MSSGQITLYERISKLVISIMFIAQRCHGNGLPADRLYEEQAS